MRRITNLIILFLLLLTISLQAQNYNITNFGAEGNTNKVCTKAINNAINACSSNGGGQVLVPPGVFLTATIVIKSNVELHLQPGAVLKGSADMNDYLQTDLTNTENIDAQGIIRSYNAENISITGKGIIDCSSDAFKIPGELHNPGDLGVEFTRQGNDYLKPKFGTDDGPVKMKKRPGFSIYFINCSNIAIEGIKIINSPHWTIRMGDCKDININNMDLITDPRVPNSDGIHFTCCENISVSDCYISSGDDALCFTTFGDRELLTQNVVVNNCILQSRSSGIRIGYGARDIKNLSFSNIIIKESNRGIGIFARDGGSISNVNFSNITIETRLHTGHWWGNGEPIHISSIHQTEKGKPGKIDNVRFSGINMKSENGIVVYSNNPNFIKDISFYNMSLEINNSKLNDGYGGNIDLRPAFQKEFSIFKSEIAGIYAKHIRMLKIDNCDIKFGHQLPDYFSSAINIENSTWVSIRNNQFTNCKQTILPRENKFMISGNSQYAK